MPLSLADASSRAVTTISSFSLAILLPSARYLQPGLICCATSTSAHTPLCQSLLNLLRSQRVAFAPPSPEPTALHPRNALQEQRRLSASLVYSPMGCPRRWPAARPSGFRWHRMRLDPLVLIFRLCDERSQVAHHLIQRFDVIPPKVSSVIFLRNSSALRCLRKYPGVSLSGATKLILLMAAPPNHGIDELDKSTGPSHRSQCGT